MVSLDPDLTDVAECYAAKTRRSLGTFQDIDSASVVVGTWRRVDSPLLDRLYYEKRPHAPGLVLGHDREDCVRQAMLRSAASAMTPAGTKRPLRLVPDDACVSRPQELDEGAEAEKMRSTIGGSRLLALLSHSDGVDAFLGGQLTLCPEPWKSERRLDASTPPCVASETCLRASLPLADTRLANHLIPTRDVAAAALVLDVCNGFLVANGAVSGGLATGLAGNPAIGLVIMPWDLVRTRPSISSDLVELLRHGVPTGRAVAWHNSSEIARHWGHRFLIIGDPACTFGEPSQRLEETSVARRRAGPRLAAPGPPSPFTARLAAFLAGRAERIGHGLKQYAGLAPAERDAFRQLVLGAFEREGTLEDYWIHESTDVATWTLDECPHCRTVLRSGHYDTRHGPRVLMRCPACVHTVLDAPAATKCRLVAGERELVLTEEPFVGDWTAKVYLRSHRHSRSWIWPGGAPRTLRAGVPDDVPDGIHKFRIFAMDDRLEMCMFGATVRKLNGKVVWPYVVTSGTDAGCTS